MSTLFEDALSSDTDCIFQDDLSSAQEVSLCPDGGEPVPMRAMFEAAAMESRPGGISAPVASVAPMLHIPERDVRAAIGRPLSTRDHFLIRGRRYRVQNPQDDGFGLLSIKLLRISHE